jgi:hypothetical protein
MPSETLTKPLLGTCQLNKSQSALRTQCPRVVLV